MKALSVVLHGISLAAIASLIYIQATPAIPAAPVVSQEQAAVAKEQADFNSHQIEINAGQKEINDNFNRTFKSQRSINHSQCLMDNMLLHINGECPE